MDPQATFVSRLSLLSPISKNADIGPPSQALLINTEEEKDHGNPGYIANVTNAIMYGIINSILAIPGIYGYAVIIFCHEDFTDFMPALSKLVIFSCFVHQVVFTLLSSLPFAIGQVQDAGLIFLGVMATSICNSLGEDVPPAAKVTTSIVTIGIATALLGICLVIMGRLKLAVVASYLPIPVIGGYLAFIGTFWFYAGFALCTGLVVNDVESMARVFYNAHDVLLCVPGFLGGIFFLVVSQRYDNSFILSGVIMAMPVVFFLIILMSGISMGDARQGGWIDPAQEPATFTDLVSLVDFSQVHWDQLPKQWGTWLGMVFIVAIGSCLDIAAIEIEMGSKLDFNHELKTVGWSNVVSGLLGGYSGSYIFSQTIFRCRSKTNSRVVGICVALSELAVVLAPVSVMNYLPRFFFAATVVFVAVDLMIEWLVLTYWKMSLRDYAVLWMTFIVVNFVSLDLGMLIGVGIAVLNFLLDYVRVPVVNRKEYFSDAERTVAERSFLEQKRDTIAYFELSGILFFGSSVQILNTIQKSVYVQSKIDQGDGGRFAETGEGQMPGNSDPMFTLEANQEFCTQCLDGSSGQPNALPTDFVVMDFSRVARMDVTAARSAFLIL
ncbi:Sulfate Permease (SulP) Family [Phytophthora cinnamomi]|uniref:Sulfate Permease (SulP) Family n=1 Tax=Phytophthora cinnamomi TaxID=4785 RepID=UPI003559CE95|nr:Sulfate Permease (SulP) Family [Phytophthora cinnamomi]